MSKFFAPLELENEKQSIYLFELFNPDIVILIASYLKNEIFIVSGNPFKNKSLSHYIKYNVQAYFSLLDGMKCMNAFSIHDQLIRMSYEYQKQINIPKMSNMAEININFACQAKHIEWMLDYVKKGIFNINQIESIKLTTDRCIDNVYCELSKFINSLPNLKKIEVNTYTYKIFESNKNITHVSFHKNGLINGNCFDEIINKFPSVKSLGFIGNSYLKEFKYMPIVSLDFSWNSTYKVDEILNIVNILPELSELNMTGCYIYKFNDLVNICQAGKKLQKVTLKCIKGIHNRNIGKFKMLCPHLQEVIIN